MMNFESLLNLIDECKTPYIQIFDTYGNPIFAFDDDDNLEATKRKLQHIIPMLEQYGKITVKAATVNIKKASWRGAYKWQVVFDKTNSTGQQKTDNAGNGNWGMVPKGYIPESMLAMQMAHLQSMNEIKLQMLKMEMEQKPKLPIPVEYLPYIGKLMGWKREDILDVASIGMQTKIAGTPEVHTTLKFKDVQKMTNEEKITKINQLLETLESKVSAEHLILLLEALNEKPELADKAVRAYQAGLI